MRGKGEQVNENTAVEVAEKPQSVTLPEAIEKVIIDGDLSPLTAEQRLVYYRAKCQAHGLNVLSAPFKYIRMNGKLVLNAGKECAEQLRKRDEISVVILERKMEEDECYTVVARATLPNGRVDDSSGSVSLQGLSGDARANGRMKAETKAKNRVTYSITGLSMLDETEVETIPGAVHVTEADLQAAKPPETDPATGFLFVMAKVTDVQEIPGISKKSGNPYVKFNVSLSTGQTVSTFAAHMADIATDARTSGKEVKVSYVEGQWGLDLKDIEFPAREVEIVTVRPAGGKSDHDMDADFRRAVENDNPFNVKRESPAPALSPESASGKTDAVVPPSAPSPGPEPVTQDQYEELLAVCQSPWSGTAGITTVRQGFGFVFKMEAFPKDLRERFQITRRYLRPNEITTAPMADAFLKFLADKKAQVR